MSKLGGPPRRGTGRVVEGDAMVPFWDNLYEVDVKSLRDMVGKAPRRFDSAPKKRRRLVSRAMDVDELECNLNPAMRECIPYIRVKEMELRQAEQEATRMVNKAQVLEAEIATLKQAERNSLLVIAAELEEGGVGIIRPGEEELATREQERFAQLLGVTKREVRRINKLVTTIDVHKIATKLDMILRASLGVSPNQQDNLEVHTDSAKAILQSHSEFMGTAEALRNASIFKDNNELLPYGTLLRTVIKAKVVTSISRGLPPTSEAYRKREDRRRLLPLPPLHYPYSQHHHHNHHLNVQPEEPWKAKDVPALSDMPPVVGLKTELQAAGTAMKANREALQADIEWISTTWRSGNQRANMVAIRLGLERLERLVNVRAWRAKHRAIRVWDAFVQCERNMQSVRLYLRYRSVQMALATVMAVRLRRLRIGLRRIQACMLVGRQLEKNACAIEMQRLMRGFLGRLQSQRVREKEAALHIQCLFRGVMCRKRLQKRRESLLRRRQTAEIQQVRR